MAVLELFKLTWENARDIERQNAVAILPVGAVEAHGPHLPLGTDIIISEAMARSGAEKLSARGWTPVLLPALAYTPANFAGGFAGTISLRPETLTALIVDVARSLSSHGFRWMAIANSHLDPAHLRSIEAATEAIRQEQLLEVVFPDISKKPWALKLSDEFKSGAAHAGQYESSVVLAEHPDLVRDEIRRELPPVRTSLSEAIREGRRTFEQAGGPRAYFGSPAGATREEGERTIEILGSILEDATVRHARG